jgi:ribosomal protein S27AE
MNRYACPRCHDVGWAEEPYYSDFQPTTRPVCCPDCNAGVVPMTRREVIEILIAFAVLLGLVAWAAK